MNKHNKLSQQHQQDQHATHQSHSVQEFNTPEEMLRFDAAQTDVPVSIAHNLQKSTIGLQPPAARPWWKRILGS